MKITQPRIKLISLIIAAVLLSVGAFVLMRDRKKSPANEAIPVVTDQSKGTNQIDYSPSSPSDNDQINDQKNNPSSGTDSPATQSITATITNTRIVGSSAQVSVLVTGATSGMCELTLTKSDNSTPITKSTNVIAKETIETCADFNVPRSDLSKGTWKASVIVKKDSLRSNVAEGILEVN